jgi:DNA-binding MarR family transcriptional regulator
VDEETLGAWRALLDVHRRVVGEVEAALAEAGLPPLSWYDVLWPLYGAERRRLRIGLLAEKVMLSRTGLSRLVDRLEAAGLLRREPAPEDRRGAYVALTPEGAALLRRMWPVYERVLDETFAPAVREPQTLRRALERIAEARSGRGTPAERFSANRRAIRAEVP